MAVISVEKTLEKTVTGNIILINIAKTFAQLRALTCEKITTFNNYMYLFTV